MDIELDNDTRLSSLWFVVKVMFMEICDFFNTSKSFLNSINSKVYQLLNWYQYRCIEFSFHPALYLIMYILLRL